MGTARTSNDACLFDGRNRFDGPASFETSGVGGFSACPDPDGAGPKVAVLSGNRCYMSGYQTTGMAGDTEFHARLNNTTTEGEQTVVFCYDPENNGCFDASVTSSITISWYR